MLARTFLIAALLAGPTTAATPLYNDALRDVCARVGQMASVLMELRQIGSAMPVHVQGLLDDPLNREIMLQAWEHPVLPEGRGRQRAVDAYRDRWVATCFRLGA